MRPNPAPPATVRQRSTTPRGRARRVWALLAGLVVVAACAGPPDEPTSAPDDQAATRSTTTGEPATTSTRGGEQPQEPPGRQPVVTTAPPVDGFASFDGTASCGSLFWNGGLVGLDLTDGMTFHVDELVIAGDWTWDQDACGDQATGAVCVDVDLPPQGCRISAVPRDPEHLDLDATIAAHGSLRCAAEVSDDDCTHAAETMLASPGTPLPLVEASQREQLQTPTTEPTVDEGQP